ncbi:hypothetical protein AV530_003276 [Patagioenas fasciata monilis]|uniref:Uncharacterized protein n=1 Tax=Patagioenas fasciata monilis TaxID=372326 RepID=A0A1V4K1V5_PATFA|nr:hypothetical protein AV530_003276 [Patagioenas fasciata monilis]
MSTEGTRIRLQSGRSWEAENTKENPWLHLLEKASSRFEMHPACYRCDTFPPECCPVHQELKPNMYLTQECLWTSWKVFGPQLINRN